ncbi:hypothetical protein Tco_1244442 [Tanacetum coccineum]
MTLAASTSTDKSLKDFDELMSTPIDFSGYILKGLKIEYLTQENQEFYNVLISNLVRITVCQHLCVEDVTTTPALTTTSVRIQKFLHLGATYDKLILLVLLRSVKEKEELKTKLENFQSVFDSKSSDVEDSPVHNRFENVEGMHAVPPPMIRNYIPSGPDREVDDSMFTYGPKQSKTSESDTQTSNYDSFWPDAPIIEEYESDNDDEYVIQPSKEQERPSFALLIIFSHLIKDCDFHEKRIAKQVELNKKKRKGTVQGENRPVWNNVQRFNHQNKFVPTAVLTRTGRTPVNTASHNFNSQAVSTSAARKVNAIRPIVNENRPRNNFYKSHSPIRRPFNRTTAPRTNF